MNRLSKNKKAKVYAWNTIGSLFNSATSLILLIFVTRICGEYDAGIFALGFANAQLMLTIGKYGMRAYQATDLKNSISFSNYLYSRIITCILMIIINIIYILLSGYNFLKGMVILSICLIKMVDALEDVFHGFFQQNLRLDIAGQSLTIRNITTNIVFIMVLIFSKNLLITCLVTGFLSLFICILLNVPQTKKMIDFKFNISKIEIKTLFISCFPLFIGSFLSLYIYNVPKYVMDWYLSSDIQTYYSILFMPAFVINLFSEFIFKPLLTDLADMWNKNKISKFLQYIGRLLISILVITIFAVGTGYLIGNKLLSLIYNVNLNNYKLEFVILLCGGGFGACVYLLYNVLTAIRKQVKLLLGYTFVAFMSTIICPLLVKNLNMMGASISYLLSSFILFITFSLILIHSVIRKKTIKIINDKGGL